MRRRYFVQFDKTIGRSFCRTTNADPWGENLLKEGWVELTFLEFYMLKIAQWFRS